MNYPIFLLLIICLSIIIGEMSALPDEEELEAIAAANQSITGSRDDIILKLSKGGEISSYLEELKRKGTYNGIDVVIKIFSEEELMRNEMKIFEVLKATENFDIKDRRIPRVYYHGPVLGEYFAIAMTRYEETLTGRMQNKKLSESTALLIFKQAVESLSYIHSKNVAHNIINEMSIFIRGKDVFIGDFESSVLGGNLINDYKNLLNLFWEMAGVLKYKDKYDKAINLKNDIIRRAMIKILLTGNIWGEFGELPNYKKIIEIADNALVEIGETSGPVEFDWLKEGEHASSSGH